MSKPNTRHVITEFDPSDLVSAYQLLGRNSIIHRFEDRNLFYNSFPEFCFDPARSRRPRKAQYSYSESASIPQDRDSPARPNTFSNYKEFVIIIPITRKQLSSH